VVITNSSVNTSSVGSRTKRVTQSASYTVLAAGADANVSRSGVSMSEKQRFDLLEEYETSQKTEIVSEKPKLPDEKSAVSKIKSLDELRRDFIKRLFSYISRGRYGIPKTPALGGAVGYTRTEFTSESESVAYSANGFVNTADGKTVNFCMSMSMSRSTETFIQTRVGVAATPSAIIKSQVDPLIINYAGTAASLTGEKFDFDLDRDGKSDKISFAGEGSGFLALDKNGDGKINDGGELFGPQSGSGFAELREYDGDGNGWLDEADEIYSRLKVWCKDKDGNDIFYTLKELDIGAIFLNENKTEFGMYDGKGQEQGSMKSTSFFLKDSGGMGIVSHFDLTV